MPATHLSQTIITFVGFREKGCSHSVCRNLIEIYATHKETKGWVEITSTYDLPQKLSHST